MAANSTITATTLKRSSSKGHGTANIQNFNKSDVTTVIVPRNSFRSEVVPDTKRETGGRISVCNVQSKLSDFRKSANTRDDPPREGVSVPPVSIGNKNIEVGNQDSIFAASVGSQPVSSTERNFVDGRCLGVGKPEGNLLMQRSPTYRHENCMFIVLETQYISISIMHILIMTDAFEVVCLIHSILQDLLSLISLCPSF